METLKKNIGKLSINNRLLNNRLTRKLIAWRLQHGAVRIPFGVGKGLLFDPSYATVAFALGVYELPVQEEMAGLLKPGDVFYDVGANIGFFSVIGAKLVGTQGQVYAFEPVPENIRILSHNLDMNHFTHVTVIPKAVSSATGGGELLLAIHPGGSALTSGDAPVDLKGSMPIELVSIDDLIFERSFKPPNVIKIDVEGAEAEVLAGLRRTLQQYHPTLVYEIDDQDPVHFKDKRDNLESILANNGYRVVRIPDSYRGSAWMVGHFLATPV